MNTSKMGGIALLIGMVIGCQTERKTSPPLEESVMLDLLTELHFLEAHYSELNTHLRDSMVRIEWTKTLSKLRLDTNDFNKARSYYGENGQAFGELEQKVLERVRQMEMK